MVSETALPARIERLSEPVGNEEMRKRLEETHRQGRKHIVFCLEFGHTRDAKSCVDAIELFNTTTTQLAEKGA